MVSSLHRGSGWFPEKQFSGHHDEPILCRSDKVVRPFFVVYSFVSILGATMDLGLMWSIADTFNGLMSIPNLIALLLLSGTVAQLTKEYFEKEKV